MDLKQKLQLHKGIGEVQKNIFFLISIFYEGHMISPVEFSRMRDKNSAEAKNWEAFNSEKNLTDLEFSF